MTQYLRRKGETETKKQGKKYFFPRNREEVRRNRASELIEALLRHDC